MAPLSLKSSARGGKASTMAAPGRFNGDGELLSLMCLVDMFAVLAGAPCALLDAVLDDEEVAVSSELPTDRHSDTLSF